MLGLFGVTEMMTGFCIFSLDHRLSRWLDGSSSQRQTVDMLWYQTADFTDEQNFPSYCCP